MKSMRKRIEEAINSMREIALTKATSERGRFADFSEILMFTMNELTERLKAAKVGELGFCEELPKEFRARLITLLTKSPYYTFPLWRIKDDVTEEYIRQEFSYLENCEDLAANNGEKLLYFNQGGSERIVDERSVKIHKEFYLLLEEFLKAMAICAKSAGCRKAGERFLEAKYMIVRGYCQFRSCLSAAEAEKVLTLINEGYIALGISLAYDNLPMLDELSMEGK